MTDLLRSQFTDKNDRQFDRKTYMREYYLNNQEKIASYQKAYAQKHREYLARYFKQYAKDNTLKISKQKHEWLIKNKEHREAYNKKYYKNKKTEMNERSAKRVKCECGKESSYGNLARHCKSKKHQKYLACLAHLTKGINPS